ncbi:MAG: hypothetical protein KGN84_16730, partial [Acidobacteriota bacterium]|nr:hypothetical protein [Acidobacteriota bacterium]
MNNTILFRNACLASLTAGAILLTACGGKQAPAAPEKKTAEPVSYFHVDPATAGTIHGKISFTGTKPPARLISMESDPACRKLNAGKKVVDDRVIVSPDGGLANAFVYVKSGLEGKKFETPQDEVVLDQHGCMFGPRVLGVMTRQPVTIRNGDPVEHNVHPAPKNNASWNEGMEPNGPDVKHRFAHPEVMIRVKCNVHGWMRAYIGVLDHPYFAV